jgi:phage terminase small subunit
MGRMFQPAAISEAKGSYLTHKNRKRPDEPKPTNSIGDPPSELSVDERKQWRRLVKEIAPGVLGESDRLPFSLLVRLATMFYNREQMKAAEMAQMINLCARFGLTPADRAKVHVEKPKESSLAQFISRKVG